MDYTTFVGWRSPVLRRKAFRHSTITGSGTRPPRIDRDGKDYNNGASFNPQDQGNIMWDLFSTSW